MSKHLSFHSPYNKYLGIRTLSVQNHLMTLLDINLIFSSALIDKKHILSPESSGETSILSKFFNILVYQKFLFEQNELVAYFLGGLMLGSGLFVIASLLKMIFFYRTRMSKDINLCENRSWRLFLLALTPVMLKFSILYLVQSMRCISVYSERVIQVPQVPLGMAAANGTFPSQASITAGSVEDGAASGLLRRTETIESRVSLLNTNIECFSVPHMILNLVLITSIILLIGVHQITKRIAVILSSKSKKALESGFFIPLLEGIILLVGVFNHFMVDWVFGYEGYLAYNYALTFLFTGLYLITAFYRPLIQKRQQNRLLRRLLVLWLLQTFSLVFKDHFILPFGSFWTTRWVLCTLLLSLALGIHRNLQIEDDNFHKLLTCIEEGSFSRREFLEIYECMLTTLEKQVPNVCTEDDQRRYLKFWEVGLSLHNKKCRKTGCFCRVPIFATETEFTRLVCVQIVHFVDLLFEEQMSGPKYPDIILKIYISFVLEVKGDYSRFVELLGQNSSFSKARISSLDRFFYGLKVQDNILFYSKKRLFRRPCQKRKVEGSAAPENNYLKICGQFFESCKNVEASIVNLTKMRLSLLDALRASRQFGKAYNSASAYRQEKTILKELLDQATGFCKGKNSYLIMLLVYYHSRVEADIKMTKSLVRRLAENFMSVDLDYLREGNKFKDTLVIYAGNESDNFHRIEMASGKAEQILGWSSDQLRGQDLSLLMPRGVKARHSSFFRKKTYFGGRLEQDDKSPAFCMNSKGDMLHCEVYIKLAYFAELGLQFMGLLIFDKIVDEDDACTLFVDEDGNILEGTRDSAVFKQNEHVQDFSKGLARSLEMLTLFYKNFAKNGRFPKYDLKEVISNEVDALLWEVYIKWQVEQPVFIKVAGGAGFEEGLFKNEERKVLVENHHFGTGMDFSFQWVVRILPMERKHWKKDFVRPCRMKFREKERLISDLNEIFGLLKKRISTHESSRGVKNVVNALMNEEERMRVKEKYEKKAMILQQTTKSLFQTSSSSFSRLQKSVKRLKLNLNKRGVKGRRALHESTTKGLDQLLEQQQESSGDNSLDMNIRRSTITNNVKSKVQFFNFFYENRREINSLKNFRRNRGGKGANFCISALALFIVVSSFIVNYYSTYLAKQVVLEIVNQTPTLNSYVRLLNSTYTTVKSIELCRLRKEGIISSENFGSQGLFEVERVCMEGIQQASEGVTQMQSLAASLNSASFQLLLDKDLLNGKSSIELSDYTRAGSQGEGLAPLNIRSTVSFFSGYSRTFAGRNYFPGPESQQDDLPLVLQSGPQNTARNRSKDPLEETMRTTLLSTFPQETVLSMNRFGTFLLSLLDVKWFLIYWEVIWVGGFGFLFILISINFSAQKICFLSNLYSLVLNFKVVISSTSKIFKIPKIIFNPFLDSTTPRLHRTSKNRAIQRQPAHERALHR